jgi:hypothetical protein
MESNNNANMFNLIGNSDVIILGGSTQQQSGSIFEVHSSLGTTYGVIANLGDNSVERDMTLQFRHSNGAGAQITTYRDSGASNGATMMLATQTTGGTLTPAIYITPAQKVGINTPTIPHGVGAAMLALDGPAASVNGPHIQLTVDTDDYPTVQILSFSHDNIAYTLDGYIIPGSGSWTSSDAGSNFQIYKVGDNLRIRGASGHAAGDAITWRETLVLAAGGNVGMGAIPEATTGALFQVISTSVSGAGARYISLLNVGATAQTIKLNVGNFIGIGVAKHSGGGVPETALFTATGAVFDFGGGNLWEVQISGSTCQAVRTGGSGTANFSILVVYI